MHFTLRWLWAHAHVGHEAHLTSVHEFVTSAPYKLAFEHLLHGDHGVAGSDVFGTWLGGGDKTMTCRQTCLHSHLHGER